MSDGKVKTTYVIDVRDLGQLYMRTESARLVPMSYTEDVCRRMPDYQALVRAKRRQIEAHIDRLEARYEHFAPSLLCSIVDAIVCRDERIPGLLVRIDRRIREAQELVDLLESEESLFPPRATSSQEQ